jgi:hypothetical protein
LTAKSANIFFNIFQSKKLPTFKHTWTIDNFRLCFAEIGDEQMSSAFSIGGINLRMLLRRGVEQHRFYFKLEPVNKNDDEAKKTFEQISCEWELMVNGNYKCIVSF